MRELTEAEIQQAAEFVDVAEFIESLPGGYNHPVTERGSTLSTGQRQLLALLEPLLLNLRFSFWMRPLPILTKRRKR